MALDGSSESSENDRPTAFPVKYRGPEAYQKPFEGSGYGVVFEDDGETGYFYATDERFSEVLDALHLYDRGTQNEIVTGDQVFIVWNPRLLKAGIHYHGQFQAVVDFKNRRACCRTGFPSPSEWCQGSHEWTAVMTSGLE